LQEWLLLGDLFSKKTYCNPYQTIEKFNVDTPNVRQKATVDDDVEAEEEDDDEVTFENVT